MSSYTPFWLNGILLLLIIGDTALLNLPDAAVFAFVTTLLLSLGAVIANITLFIRAFRKQESQVARLYGLGAILIIALFWYLSTGLSRLGDSAHH